MQSTIDYNILEVSSGILRAITHPLRLTILEFIQEHGTANVQLIYTTLKLEQSITSQHLRILRKAGLVSTERDGKFVNYRVNTERVRNTLQVVQQFLADNEKMN